MDQIFFIFIKNKKYFYILINMQSYLPAIQSYVAPLAEKARQFVVPSVFDEKLLGKETPMDYYGMQSESIGRENWWESKEVNRMNKYIANIIVAEDIEFKWQMRNNREMFQCVFHNENDIGYLSENRVCKTVNTSQLRPQYKTQISGAILELMGEPFNLTIDEILTKCKEMKRVQIFPEWSARGILRSGKHGVWEAYYHKITELWIKSGDGYDWLGISGQVPDKKYETSDPFPRVETVSRPTTPRPAGFKWAPGNDVCDVPQYYPVDGRLTRSRSQRELDRLRGRYSEMYGGTRRSQRLRRGPGSRRIRKKK